MEVMVCSLPARTRACFGEGWDGQGRKMNVCPVYTATVHTMDRACQDRYPRISASPPKQLLSLAVDAVPSHHQTHDRSMTS